MKLLEKIKLPNIKLPQIRLSSLFCKAGLHRWEEQPQKDPIRSTGMKCAFWSAVMQTGKRGCTRKPCEAHYLVMREGQLKEGEVTGPWQKIKPARKAEIDKMKVL